MECKKINAIKRGILLLCIVLVFQNCSKEENVTNLFSPPNRIHGIWGGKKNSQNPLIRLTITSNNIIEENYNGRLFPVEYINYNEVFNTKEHNINEVITQDSYEVIIERKDGQFILGKKNIKSVRRKSVRSALVSNGVAKDALQLDYLGTSGLYLVRE